MAQLPDRINDLCESISIAVNGHERSMVLAALAATVSMIIVDAHPAERRDIFDDFLIVLKETMEMQMSEAIANDNRSR